MVGFINITKLRERGWSRSMIRKLLDPPDRTVQDPKYRNAAPSTGRPGVDTAYEIIRKRCDDMIDERYPTLRAGEPEAEDRDRGDQPAEAGMSQ